MSEPQLQPDGAQRVRVRRYPYVLAPEGATIRDLVDDLEAALLRRGRSPKTVEIYRWGLAQFIEFAEAAGVYQVGDVTEELLEGWQDSLIARKLAPSSRSLAATAAKALIKHGSRKHLMDRALEDSVEAVSVPKHLPRPLGPSALSAVLAALREPPKRATVAQLRNRALFLYLLTTGARVSEILRIQRDDYERPIVRQKGRSEKKLYPPPVVIEAVRQYVAQRVDSLPELWVAHVRGKESFPLTPGAVRGIWTRLAAELGLDRWTTHQVRHTSASILSDANVADLVIAEHLGHHGLATLANYAAISDGRRGVVTGIFEHLLAPAPPPEPARVLRLPINKRRRRKRR